MQSGNSLQTANHDISDIYKQLLGAHSEAKKKMYLGPIPHRAPPCEEFFPGAVATIALWQSAPMISTLYTVSYFSLRPQCSSVSRISVYLSYGFFSRAGPNYIQGGDADVSCTAWFRTTLLGVVIHMCRRHAAPTRAQVRLH